MCARITLTTTSAEIADLFGLAYDLSEPVRPRFNIAPSQQVAALRVNADTGREWAHLRWGLIPHWNSNRHHTGFVNARAETAASKPAFRDPFRYRRCLIPADGFYEWETIGTRKQPYFFRKVGGGPFAYAGIWDRWAGPVGTVESCAVLTVPANDLVRPLHDRMPAILPESLFAEWLNPQLEQAEPLLRLLATFPAEQMERWPVSRRVNAPFVEEAGLNAAVQLDERRPRHQPGLFDVA